MARKYRGRPLVVKKSAGLRVEIPGIINYKVVTRLMKEIDSDLVEAVKLYGRLNKSWRRLQAFYGKEN